MSQKDFEYNESDINLVKAAYNTLVDEENTAFKLGLFTTLLTVLVIPRTTRFKNLTNLGSLFLGASVYNIWSHQARDHYSRVASRANRNASYQIAKLMEY